MLHDCYQNNVKTQIYVTNSKNLSYHNMLVSKYSLCGVFSPKKPLEWCLII